MSNDVIRNPDFWNQLYIDKDTGWDIGHPTPIFVNWSKTLNSKLKILIPGCGNCYDGLYLSKQNHHVYALDFSENVIAEIIKKSKNEKVPIKVICDDYFLLDKSYYNKFDIVLEYTFFCAIPINMRELYVKQTYNMLKPGGHLVAIFIPISKKTKKEGPPFYVDLNITLNMFEKYFIVESVDMNPQSIKQRNGNEAFVTMVRK